MKKIFLRGLGIMLLALLAGCSSYQYYAIQSGSAEMNRYRTFAWLPYISALPDSGITDIDDEKIKDEATAQLESKGLQLLAKNPDLLLRYSLMVSDKVKTFNEPLYTYPIGGMYLGRGMYRRKHTYFYSYANPYPVYIGDNIVRVPYKEGTLIIDLIDRRENRVIWRGYGVGEIDNPASAVRDIPQLVKGILAKLPMKVIG